MSSLPSIGNIINSVKKAFSNTTKPRGRRPEHDVVAKTTPRNLTPKPRAAVSNTSTRRANSPPVKPQTPPTQPTKPRGRRPEHDVVAKTTPRNLTPKPRAVVPNTSTRRANSPPVKPQTPPTQPTKPIQEKSKVNNPPAKPITWQLNSEKEKTNKANPSRPAGGTNESPLRNNTAQAKPKAQTLTQSKVIQVNGASIKGGPDLIAGGDGQTFTQGGKTFKVQSVTNGVGGRDTTITELDQNRKPIGQPSRFSKSWAFATTEKKLQPISNPPPQRSANGSVVPRTATSPSSPPASSNTQQSLQRNSNRDAINKIVKEKNPKYRVEQKGDTCAIYSTTNAARHQGIAPNMDFKIEGNQIVVTWHDGHKSRIPKQAYSNQQDLIADVYLQRYPEERNGTLASRVQERLYGEPSTTVGHKQFNDKATQKALESRGTVAILGGTITDANGVPDGYHGFSLMSKPDGTWEVYNSNARQNVPGMPLLGATNTSKPVTTLTQAQLEKILKENPKAFITYTQVNP
ncbi:MAG: hypothetical protein LW809_02135 [Vampirovibrionales bacterium]|jgi:hypothetical protein|nr:hypothetical protein [Vampirovibrionales bacterium]